MSTRANHPIQPAKTSVVNYFASRQPIALGDRSVVVIHRVPRANTRDHIQTNSRVMSIANNFATEETSERVSESVTTRVNKVQRRELSQRLPRQVNRAETLSYHRETRVRPLLDPFPFLKMNHLGRREEIDAESIDGAAG